MPSLPSGQYALRPWSLVALTGLSFSLMLPACSTTPSKGAKVASTIGADAAVVDTNAYPPASSQEEAFTNVGKRLLGLDPSQGDAGNAIGLMNVADVMGYKYAFNDCKKPWNAVVGANYEVELSSDHTGDSANPKCGQTDDTAPVHYKLSSWRVKGQAVKIVPQTTDEAAAVPKSMASSAAKPGTSAVTIDPDTGRLQVVTPEIIVAELDNSTNSDATMHISYQGTVTTDHKITTATMAQHQAGISISFGGSFGVPLIGDTTFNVTGSYSFTYSTTTTHEATTTNAQQVTCISDVTQPKGCYFRATMTANHVVARGHYRGYLTAVPQIATLTGALTDIGDCESVPYRRASGTCRGENVTYALGADGSRNFIEAVRVHANQPDTDKDWYWAGIKTQPQHQTGGQSDLNNALNLWDSGAFSRFALDFYDVTESITSCSTVVEVLPGSSDDCKAPNAKVTSTGLGSPP